MQINSARGRNKAADLKKLMQEACNSQKVQVTETNPPLSYRDRDLKDLSKSRWANKSTQSTTLLTQMKEVSTKKGLTTISHKNKENLCSNKIDSKFEKNKLTSSVSLKSKIPSVTTKSLKQIKINPISTSIELPKMIKTITSSTSRTKKTLKFESSYDSLRMPPATARDRSPRPILRRKGAFKISDFNLGRKLGKGRFGHVRIAQDKVTKMVLAIKTINIAQLKQSQMQSQLVEQIKLQMYCNHPNILKMYGFFGDSKNIYMLLELGSACLFQELRTEKHFDQEKTANYIKQVIESLKYVHSENIIHRDIKPENILVTHGVLKLSDFGWSTYSPLLKRQTFCGTLDYVSPEVVIGDYYDEKVDIWSLGVLIYELAIGKAPFEDPNSDQEAIYDRILSCEIDFPEHLSEELKDLISKILPKNPNQRLSISEIEGHPWLRKYKTTGRYISKEIWDSWVSLRTEEND